ncbi:MAG: hypothetical protein RLZZ360_377 [Candidatus Parcubacteria bacterium]|jgi:hypothetical protein
MFSDVRRCVALGAATWSKKLKMQGYVLECSGNPIPALGTTKFSNALKNIAFVER